MAARSKVTLPSFGLTLQGSVSLLNHIIFFKYLASDAFYRDFRVQFERSEVLERIQTAAKFLIQGAIYGAYTPKKYVRTDRLLNSFDVIADTGDPVANINLFSRPEVAKAELLPGHSYAEFFDPQSQFRSFLLNVLQPEDAIRPFVEDLAFLMEAILPEEALDAFEFAMKTNKPPD